MDGQSCSVMVCDECAHTHTQRHAPLLDAVEGTALEAAAPNLATTATKLWHGTPEAGDVCLISSIVDHLSRKVHEVWMVYTTHCNGRYAVAAHETAQPCMVCERLTHDRRT